MYNTALISAPMGRSYYWVTLVNGEIERTFTCRNLSEVISTINSNGVYNDSIESYDMAEKSMEQIKRKINARPTPFIIASMGGTSFCTDPALTIESATELAIEFGACEELIFPAAMVDDRKATITASNDEIHVLYINQAGKYIDKVHKLGSDHTNKAIDVVWWKDDLDADLYFAPNTSQELISAVYSLLGVKQ